MDIKKLGLASVIAVLSVTVMLSGCDLFESPGQKTARLTKQEKEDKFSEAVSKYWKIYDERRKIYNERKRFSSDSSEYKELSIRLKEAEKEETEAHNAYMEMS